MPSENLAWTYFEKDAKYFCGYGCINGACIKSNPPEVYVTMPNSFTLSVGQVAVVSNLGGVKIKLESVVRNVPCTGSNCPASNLKEFVIVNVQTTDGTKKEYQIFDDETVSLEGIKGVGLSLIGFSVSGAMFNIRLVNSGGGGEVKGTLHKGEMGVYFVDRTGIRVEISDVVFNVNGKSLTRFILSLDEETSVQAKGTLSKGESAKYKLGGDEFEFGVVDIIPSDVVRFTIKKVEEDSKGGGCAAVYEPICGLDGKTYPNSCGLENAGQSASCDGTCPCPTNRIDGTLKIGEEGTYTLAGKKYKIVPRFNLSIHIGFRNGEYTNDSGGSFSIIMFVSGVGGETKELRLQEYESEVFEMDGRKLRLFIKDLIVEGAWSDLLTRFALFDLGGDYVCPTLVPPSPDACPDGRWIYQGADENGCQRPPVCNTESEEERACRTDTDCSQLVTCPNGRRYYPLICGLDGRCEEAYFAGGNPCFDESGGERPPGEEVCDGCRSNGVCLNVGVRLERDGSAQYCDLDGGFKTQKGIGGSCQNDFECETNSCSNGVCYDIQKELRETRGLLERILDWFSRLFGGR